MNMMIRYLLILLPLISTQAMEDQSRLISVTLVDDRLEVISGVEFSFGSGWLDGC